MSMLKTDNLIVGYEKKKVVDGVDIQGLKGQVVCLLGANGAGKTTILRTLSGLLAPLQGVVFLKDQNIATIDRKELAKQLSIVLTKRLSGEMMSVYEVVSMGRYPHTGFFGRLTAEDERKIEEALQTVHASHLTERFFDELSDGEKQKVLVARAFVQEPEVMILDEPTTHLDIRHRLELIDILKRLSKEKGITVMLSLHEIDIALKSCDQVVLVHNGKILASGVPEEVVNESIINQLYGIENGTYNNLLGSVEIANSSASDVFVIGGGGYGTPVYRILTRHGIGLTTGILHENDVDFEVARTIGLDILREKVFEPIQEKTFLQALKKVDAVPSIIDAGSPIGTGNDKNRAIIEYALTKGKNVYSLRSEQEQAMLFDQYASRIHFCANVSNVIEKMSFL